MIVLKDRVKQITTTEGTGNVTFGSTPNGFQSFDSVLSSGNITYYCLENGTAWEVGEGTYLGSGILSRDTVLDSSTGSKLNLSGRSAAFITYPADRMTYLDNLNEMNISLEAMNDVGLTAPASGEALLYNGSEWANSTLPVGYTDEDAQDAVGGILANSSSVSFSYSDGTPSITAVIATSGIVDAMVSSGIDAVKLADGTVTNTEFQYIGSLTSNAQDQLDAKAPLASPTFTGVPEAPTATGGTSTTQIATTAFVTSAVGSIDLTPYLTTATAATTYLPLAGGTLTGDLLFTDATYDIGKTGATRPRDGFFSRNLSVGGSGTFAAGTITASTPIQITQAWNAIGTTFSALEIVCTGLGTSSVTSKLFDINFDGTSLFKITKQGRITSDAGGHDFYSSTTPIASIDQYKRVIVRSDGAFGFANSTSVSSSATADALFTRSGAGAVRLVAMSVPGVTSTNVSCFSINNVFTSSTSFEDFQIKANAGAAYQIGSAIGSAGGTNRGIDFGTWNAVGTFTASVSINKDGTSAPLRLTVPDDGPYVMRVVNTTYHATTPVFDFYAKNSGEFSFGTNVNSNLEFYTNGYTGIRFSLSGANGFSSFTPSAATSGSPTLFTITGAAHTTLTASTEATDINFNLARTVQFATGALTTQRAMRIQAPTYSFVGASTITTASTLSISGAPVAGTNATITNPYALNVESGNINVQNGNIKFSTSSRGISGQYTFLSSSASAETWTVAANYPDCLAISANNGIVSKTVIFRRGYTPGIMMDGDWHLQWAANSYSNASCDLAITRDAAGVLAQRVGTNAQTFRLYNTYTSSTSFENLQFKAVAASAYQIGSAIGSAGGTNRAIEIGHYNSGGTFTSALSVATSGAATFAGTINGRASTTAADTAPIKLPTGVLMTTPEAGAIEYDGTSLYYTNSGAARQTLATSASVIGGSTGAVDNSVLRADGTGGATLQSSAIVIADNYTASPNNTVNHASIQATGGTTDVSVSIVPKGTGAFTLAVPDGTATGGNARGTNAVDLQTVRSAATQVASGLYSVVAGRNSIASGTYGVALGYQCTASGAWSFAVGNESVASGNTSVAMGTGTANAQGAVAIGESTSATSTGAVAIGSIITASGSYSFCSNYLGVASASFSIAMGYYPLADRYAMVAIAGGIFSARGDAQSARFVLRRKTTDATPTTLMLDGSSTRLTIPSGKTMSANVIVSGIKSDGSAKCTFWRKVVITNVGGTTTLDAEIKEHDAKDVAGCDVTITADDTNDALQIDVTGVAAETWRWVCVVEGLEIAYGV